MTYSTREEWLGSAAGAELSKVIEQAHGSSWTTFRVSCGWPGGGTRTRIGECWSPKASDGKITEIFISPAVSDPVEVLDILLHELVHATVGCEHGHKGPFRKLALAVGLTGKMTATEAGPELKAKLEAIAKRLGPYPHSKLNRSDRKKQTTRMIKCACACGYTCRTTRSWLDKAGAPICPACEIAMVSQ